MLRRLNTTMNRIILSVLMILVLCVVIMTLAGCSSKQVVNRNNETYYTHSSNIILMKE